MLKWFICPDEEQVEVTDCLQSCRMGERCLTQPTLAFLGKEREWTGTPSTTQMLDGTMYWFLKITNDYAIAPKSKAFALLGTIHHKKLEEVATSLGLPAELSITEDDKNIFDLLEVEYDKEGLPLYTLTDYKTWGSYKVARTLGVKVVREEEEFYTDKYGKPKKRKKKVFEEVSEEADNHDVMLQLNHYVVMLKDKFGLEVNKLQIQITVRDGGLQVATSRGVDELMYKRSLPIMKEQEVREYFEYKARALKLSLEAGKWEVPCTSHENWDGARCARYCEVVDKCQHGRMVVTNSYRR